MRALDVWNLEHSGELNQIVSFTGTDADGSLDIDLFNGANCSDWDCSLGHFTYNMSWEGESNPPYGGMNVLICPTEERCTYTSGALAGYTYTTYFSGEEEANRCTVFESPGSVICELLKGMDPNVVID